MPITAKQLSTMEHRVRVQFINSLSGFKSANLIGTCDESGQTNLAIMSSAFHLGASPALVGLIVRPDVAERHTLRNIRSTGQYTMSHVNEATYQAAHQTSARYPKHVSEFDAVGLTPDFMAGFKAPAVKEATIKIGLELRQEQRLEINGTHLVIGEIMWVDVPNELIAEDGFVDLTKAGTMALSGLDAYCSAGLTERLPYAKVPQQKN